MKDKTIAAICFLLFIVFSYAQENGVATESDVNTAEVEETKTPREDEKFDDLFDQLNLDSVLNHPDQPHLPATEEMQRLVDHLENIKVTDYNEDFEEHHLDFIDLESDL